MTITIKKISNYTLLGTIISASVTAPAQASSIANVDSNDDLIQNPQNQASSDRKDILVKTQKCNEANSCISLPNFDLDSEFNKNNDTNTLNNSLLKKAKRIIKSIEAAEAVKVITSSEGIEYIIYDAEFTPSESKYQSALNTYTNVRRSESQKKKVPEPSALLGLIAFGLLAAKRKVAKNIPKSIA